MIWKQKHIGCVFSRDGSMLKFVPDYMKTEAVCLAAVSKNVPDVLEQEVMSAVSSSNK